MKIFKFRSSVLFVVLATLVLPVFAQKKATPKGVAVDPNVVRGREIMDKAMAKLSADNRVMQESFSYEEKRITINYNFRSGKEENRREEIYVIKPINGVPHQRRFGDLTDNYKPVDDTKEQGHKIKVDASFANGFNFRLKESPSADSPFHVLEFYEKAGVKPVGRGIIEKNIYKTAMKFKGTVEVWADDFSIKTWYGKLGEKFSSSIFATAEDGEFTFSLIRLPGNLAFLEKYDLLTKVNLCLLCPMKDIYRRTIKERKDFQKVAP